ncbi:MAG: hypothetical protein JWR22_2920 [Herminiimonas sp.]|nr:hypothetical protein [Herminiimonas sp.]
MPGEEMLACPEPQLTEDGVAFVVRVEHQGRPCLVTRDALTRLCDETGFMMDPMNIYRAFEARINSVARRLVFTGADQSPLVIGPHYFH